MLVRSSIFVLAELRLPPINSGICKVRCGMGGLVIVVWENAHQQLSNCWVHSFNRLYTSSRQSCRLRFFHRGRVAVVVCRDVNSVLLQWLLLLFIVPADSTECQVFIPDYQACLAVIACTFISSSNSNCV